MGLKADDSLHTFSSKSQACTGHRHQRYDARFEKVWMCALALVQATHKGQSFHFTPMRHVSLPNYLTCMLGCNLWKITILYINIITFQWGASLLAPFSCKERKLNTNMLHRQFDDG